MNQVDPHYVAPLGVDPLHLRESSQYFRSNSYDWRQLGETYLGNTYWPRILYVTQAEEVMYIFLPPRGTITAIRLGLSN